MPSAHKDTKLTARPLGAVNAVTAILTCLLVGTSGCFSGSLSSLSPQQQKIKRTTDDKTDLGPSSSAAVTEKRTVSRPLIDNILFGPARSAEHGNWTLPPHTEEVRFASADGTQLHGWLSRAAQPKHVVLFTHGNGGNVSYSGGVLQLLRDRYQATCLAFDYRGYGRSKGKPTLEGVVADAAAARRLLAKKTGVREQDIILWGHSMGGAIAIQLTQQLTPRALVLDSTFSSLRDEAAHVSPNLAWMVNRRLWNSADVIAGYAGPVFIMHGDADRVIPWTQGRTLHAAVVEGNADRVDTRPANADVPRTFLRLTGGRHNSSLWHADAQQPLDRFLRNIPAAEPPAR